MGRSRTVRARSRTSRPSGTSIAQHHAALDVVDLAEMHDLAPGRPDHRARGSFGSAPAAMVLVVLESLPAAHKRGRRLRRRDPRIKGQQVGIARGHGRQGPRIQGLSRVENAMSAKSPVKSLKTCQMRISAVGQELGGHETVAVPTSPWRSPRRTHKQPLRGIPPNSRLT